MIQEKVSDKDFSGLRLLPVLLVLLLLAASRVIASNILFVGATNPLSGGDAALSTVLTGLGHVVTPKAATASLASDASGKDLVIVSASVTSTDVNTKFKTVTQPVLVFENGILDDMAMTPTTAGTFGTVSGATQINITNSGHQIAAGLSGAVSVYNAADLLTFGQPSAAAVVIASVVGDATKPVIFTYNTGDAMVGFTAPGKRVGFFMETNGGTSANANGLALFKAAVSWALGLTPPSITSALTATTTAGTAVSYTITATGTTPITYSATGLPAGLSLSGAVISGTPGAAGTTNVTLNANNITGSTSTKTLVIQQAPAITSALTATTTAGTAFSYTITASGTSPFTFSATGLPPGLSLGANGLISGTPTASNTASVTLGAQGVGSAPNKTLVISQAPAITSVLAVTANTGTAFSYTITASGSTPITFGATGLPSWLAFNAGTATLSGTPTVTGTANISLTASGVGSAPGKTLIITINSAPVAPAITGQPQSVSVFPGQAGSLSVTATGSPLNYQWFKNSTAIPSATSATLSSASLSGADHGLYKVRVYNTAGEVYSNEVALNVLVSSTSITYGNDVSNPAVSNAISATTGSANSGFLTALDVTATTGINHSGNVKALKVTTVTGPNQAGDAYGIDVSATTGNNVGNLTGLNVSASSATGSTGNLTGLRVDVSNSASAGTKNAALFTGGRVGIGTVSPQTDLDIKGKVRILGTTGTPGGDLSLEGQGWLGPQNESMSSAADVNYRTGMRQAEAVTGNGYTEQKGAVANVDSVFLFDSTFVSGGASSISVTKTNIQAGKLKATYASSSGGVHSDSRTVEVDPLLGIKYTSTLDGVTSQTTIDGTGLATTAMVLTPKWKVASAPVPPDYVFDKGYKLRSLAETEKYVKANKHLPEVPAAKEMMAKGVDVMEMNFQLLRKVEELTLHMIEMDKELKALKASTVK